MAGLALALMIAYLALAFGVRVAVALRTTGATGIVGIGSAPPIELLGGGLFFSGVVLGGVNPVLVLIDAVEPIDGLESTPGQVVGIILCVTGIAGTFGAQMAMGSSWRIGVDPGERTELVTGGVFSLCRNPIYTFMLIAWVGFALLLPTWIAFAAGVLLITGLELQVRLVEEPHLLRTHSGPYREYAARVGRFLPGIGQIRG